MFRALKHFLPDLRDYHLLVRADILSRQGLRPGEWMLHPEGEADMESLGQASFATRQTPYCPLWLSLTHPALQGLDAMIQTWPRLRLFAFP